MKRWLAVLGVLLAGALLLPQHAWSQGTVVNDWLQVKGTSPYIQLSNLSSGYTGTLQPATLTGNRTWTLPDASGTILLSSTIGTTAWLLTGNSITGTEFLGTTNAQPLVIRTDNVERMRVTATGDVVVQNQAGGTTVLRVLGGGGGTGATQVVLQAGAGQSGVNLLEWVDDLGNTQGVIDANGLVGIGTTAPVQRLHVVGNGSVSAVFVDGGVGVGTVTPLATLHVYDEGTLTLGATRVIIQAGANQTGVNLLEWQDDLGNILGVIDAGGLVGIGTASPTERLQVSDGNIAITNTDGTARQLRLYEPSGAGANFTAFQAQAQASDITYTLPASLTPTSVVGVGILQTDAFGNLSWLDPSALGGGGAGWALTGNSGTNPTTNFLGTTDAQPLVIRVGNQETFRFNPPGTSAPAWSIQRGGGNQRGLHAVDLQSARSAATQVASGDYSVIGGGYANTASGVVATVGGGVGNTASNWYATVGGGISNTASGVVATVGGGESNYAIGDYATVGGGESNYAIGDYATVGGGIYNAASDYATVGGGLANGANGGATVGGGYLNIASGGYATVGGGSQNTASGGSATVGGGHANTASGGFATVSGGGGNIASGDWATIGGGYLNTASGLCSVVLGGLTNTANADYNLVFGENVDPSVTETHRVYLFGDGSCPPSENCRSSGFLVINRLDGDYPIHVGTNTTNGNGARLTTGGVWTNGSSRSFKERFVQYRPAEVLEKIRQLPVEGYFYKGTEEYHITPMAEDFYRLFGTGVHEIIETDSTGQLVRRPNPDVDKYLAASDVAGVALLGVKALDELISTLGLQSGALAQRLEALEQENQQIKQENRHLQQRVEVLQQQNGRLQQQLEQVMERLALVEAQLQQGGSTAGENAWLGQNIPNPFAGTTTIPYYIPAGVSRAELVVRDVGGRELKRLELAERGAHGQVVLEMGLLGSGTYEYALVLDGRTVASRQMLLLK
jgi:hypothetical protein